jgi:heat shock protein beta
VTGCGDGHLAAGEGCDDGNNTAGDGCNAACLVENTKACNATVPGLIGDPSCASGVCDLTGGGTGVCKAAGCGDGRLEAGEGCDDGGTVAGDGCDATCRIENTKPCNTMAPGATGDASCASGTCDLTGGGAGVCEVTGCGDGHLAAGEGCDDGNTTAGDGCDAGCKIENTKPCNATVPGAIGDASCASGTCDLTGGGAGVCEPTGCGDGHLSATEGCDDGNATAGDGCDASCKIENTKACNATVPGLTGDASCASGACDLTGGGAGVCEAVGCGDGHLSATEGCDDGNTTGGDGCNAMCLIESTHPCNATVPGLTGNASCASNVCNVTEGAPGICEGIDTDGDGVPDQIDLDDDNDGILDTEEGDGAVDTDGDGVPDSLDLDSDNDGILDVTEAGHHLGDADSDGVIDCPAGFGANGLCDDLETVPESGLPDYNGDGIADAKPRDTDADGVPDYRDLDSDDDGLADAVEAGHHIGDTDGDGIIDCPAGFGANGLCDALETTPDSGAPDYNGDGTMDGQPRDTDGDGVPDYRDLDSDDDGISDLIEGGSGCADANNDSVCDGTDEDGDGIRSSADGAPAKFGDAGATAPTDTDGDKVPDYRDLDSDDDGLSDLVEGGSGCADADGNAVCDGTDEDGDGIRSSADGAPTVFGDAGVTAPPNTDGRGPADYRDLDSDDDGISDLVEGGSGCADVDGNGVCDGTDEDGDGIRSSADGAPTVFGDAGAGAPTDTDKDGTPDFRDLNSDGDLINDIDEGGHGDLDTDGDGRIDDPADGDGDGIVDVVDDMPTVFGGLADPKRDHNHDGIPDFQDPDSDDDGILDGYGVSGGGCSAAPSGGTNALSAMFVLAGMLAARRRRRRPAA